MRYAESGLASMGPTVNNHPPVTGLFWLLKWFIIVTLLVLLIQLFCVFVLWSPDGVDQLERLLLEELALLNLTSTEQSKLIAMTQYFYRIVFIETGIDSWLSHSAKVPANQQQNLHDLVNDFRPVIEAMMIGLQLYALRLGVLFLTLPLILIVIMVAVSDGILGWYLRRTSADRESGFIYHRAKRGLGWSIVILWICYLLPQTPIDPKLLIPPFLIVAGITIRLQVAYFKKFL